MNLNMANEFYRNVFLARLHGQAGRYSDTKHIIKKSIKTGIEPNAEEQKLLSIAYSKLQHTLRDSWRVISAVEHDEKAKEEGRYIEEIEESRTDIEAELENLCNEVISLIEDTISPNATTDETRLFCLKM